MAGGPCGRNLADFERQKPGGLFGGALLRPGERKAWAEDFGEETVARLASCGITLLSRVLLLLQVSPCARRGVWGAVEAWREKSDNWKAAMRLTEPARSSERLAGGRVNQTGFLDEAQEECDA